VDITVRGQHFEVPDSVEERARRKLGRLDHYLPLLHDAVVEVDITHERAKEPDQRYLVCVTVDGGGVHLRAEERAAALETAVDEAARALAAQARRHKQRLYERGRVKVSPEAIAEKAGAKSSSDKVMRVKRFEVKPMTVNEAVEEMEALGHEFFVFHHAQAGQFAVLYRRRAGDYGVIIPELS
jgi:putative sigma-54 modulation protein